MHYPNSIVRGPYTSSRSFAPKYVDAHGCPRTFKELPLSSSPRSPHMRERARPRVLFNFSGPPGVFSLSGFLYRIREFRKRERERKRASEGDRSGPVVWKTKAVHSSRRRSFLLIYRGRRECVENFIGIRRGEFPLSPRASEFSVRRRGIKVRNFSFADAAARGQPIGSGFSFCSCFAASSEVSIFDAEFEIP